MYDSPADDFAVALWGRYIYGLKVFIVYAAAKNKICSDIRPQDM